jgi:hypothetical protein
MPAALRGRPTKGIAIAPARTIQNLFNRPLLVCAIETVLMASGGVRVKQKYQLYKRVNV